jgi:hypothetical protein
VQVVFFLLAPVVAAAAFVSARLSQPGAALCVGSICAFAQGVTVAPRFTLAPTNSIIALVFVVLLPVAAATATAVWFSKSVAHVRVAAFVGAYALAAFTFPMLGLAVGAWTL